MLCNDDNRFWLFHSRVLEGIPGASGREWVQAHEDDAVYFLPYSFLGVFELGSEVFQFDPALACRTHPLFHISCDDGGVLYDLLRGQREALNVRRR